MAQSQTPTVSFRWGRSDELDEQLPEDVHRSEAMRAILDDWIDNPDESVLE
jgi:hypothetical protein